MLRPLRNLLDSSELIDLPDGKGVIKLGDEVSCDTWRNRNFAMTSCRLDEYKPAPYFNGGRIFRKVTPTVHSPTPLRSKTTERFGIAPLTCVKGKINFPVVAPFLPTARIARRTETPTMGQVPDFANDNEPLREAA
jgi:hypothetical protein